MAPHPELVEGGIVEIVLLPLVEGLGVFGRHDARLEAQFAQGPTNEMRAQAGFHTDDAAWQLLEGRHQRQTFDLTPQYDLAVEIKADQMEDVLADVDADGSQRGKALL
jgi:hypothetical protein